MADKEATVFVIDMGASMGKTTQGRSLNNLDWVMQYVWDKIMSKVRYSQVKSLTERCFQAERLMLLVSLDFVRTVSPFYAQLTVRNGQWAQRRGTLSQYHGAFAHSTVFLFMGSWLTSSESWCLKFGRYRNFAFQAEPTRVMVICILSNSTKMWSNFSVGCRRGCHHEILQTSQVHQEYYLDNRCSWQSWLGWKRGHC